MKRDSYPPGVPCWIDATHPDAAAAAAFYSDILGWTYEDRMPGDAHYFVAQLDGLDAAGFAEGGSSGWLTYVSVEDADAAAARVREAGGTVTLEPQDVMDLGRTAVFADPAGAPFAVWQPGRRAGLGVVNAPGSWNWSNLHTRDLDGAARFYGAVFGWEAATIDFGGGMEATMLQLPGYGDALAVRDPGISRAPRRAPARRPASPMRWRGSSRSRRTSRPAGTSRSRRPTPTRSWRARRSSAARSSTRPSTPAPCAWPRSATRRAPRSA